MATTIAAGDIAAQDSGRSLVRTSLGVIWAAVDDGSGNVDWWYSDDDGATWTEDTSASLTSRTLWGVSIDGGDYLHAHSTNGSNYYYHWGSLNSAHTELTWTTVAGVSALLKGDAVGYTLSSVSTGIQAGRPSSTAQVNFERFTGGASATGDPPSFTTTGVVEELCVDFHHTGDGVTVASGTPHLYVAYRESAAAKFRKGTWAAGAWTWGAARTLKASGVSEVHGIAFDGARVLVLVRSGSSTLEVYERDAGDTATTTRAAPAAPVTGFNNAAVAFDTYGDIHVFCRDTGDNDVYRVAYDRSAGSWGSWSALEVGTYSDVACARFHRASRVEVLVEDATNVSHSSISLNVAPTAAPWVTVDGAYDRDETLPLDWDFADPDDGDTQSAYALSRVVNGGSAEYYNAGGGTWSGTETKNTSTTTAVTLASAWAADGDAVVYKVKTWDAADTEGVYSAALNVTASVQVNPTLSTPADAGTVTTNTVSMTWSVGEQTAYRARLYNTAQTVTHEDSGWVTSTSTSHAFAFILTDGVDYKVGVQTRNAEGLDSDEDVHSFTADFTEPATPTLNVTADGDHIDVTVTNPTPTGSQPDVTGNDLFARVAAGGVSDGYRPVGGGGVRIATGVAENGSYVDWAAGDGYSYEYLARAVGDNGTTADSAWTS